MNLKDSNLNKSAYELVENELAPASEELPADLFTTPLLNLYWKAYLNISDGLLTAMSVYKPRQEKL